MPNNAKKNMFQYSTHCVYFTVLLSLCIFCIFAQTVIYLKGNIIASKDPLLSKTDNCGDYRTGVAVNRWLAE